MAEFCFPLPALALSALMNMPPSASEEFMGHMRKLDEVNWDPNKVNEMNFGMFAATVSRIVQERRGHELDPEADLISGAMLLEVNGRRLTDDEVVQIGVQIVAAGHQTTAERSDRRSTASRRTRRPRRGYGVIPSSSRPRSRSSSASRRRFTSSRETPPKTSRSAAVPSRRGRAWR